MMQETLPEGDRTTTSEPLNQSQSTIQSIQTTSKPADQAQPTIQQTQEVIYDYLLDLVDRYPPDAVLVEFQNLFARPTDSTSSGALQALYLIVINNDEAEFKNTLKRSLYILVNNWYLTRQYLAIKNLINSLEQLVAGPPPLSLSLRRLREWIHSFLQGQDYKELKLFATTFDQEAQQNWSHRYTAYLLVPQYVNLENPVEQREAARALSQQLKEKFKMDLALYTAHIEPASSSKLHNPTALGDEALRLIKRIVAKQGAFSYANLASIFLNQTQNMNYQLFKQSLQRYLIPQRIAQASDFVNTLNVELKTRLSDLYSNYHAESLNDDLLLRTCNRTIDFFTIETKQTPSFLFKLLLSQGNPLNLAVVLLKIILICKNSRSHLESRIAELIRYYEAYPEAECKSVIHFLEIFNIALTIYAENVQYNLVKVQQKTCALTASPIVVNELDNYRIFSQLKNELKLRGNNLSGMELVGVDLRGADLYGANLSASNLSEADLSNADLRSSDLQNTNLSQADLMTSLLNQANLTEANLQGADLRRAIFKGANLQRANLKMVKLQLADLSNADLSMAQLMSSNLNGAQLLNANLSETKLSHADLSDANLSHANLNQTNLSHSDLSRAQLNQADLRGADLTRASLMSADLRGANLQAADLTRADLSGADLTGVDLSQVRVKNTWFGSNKGLSEQDAIALKHRGAIFSDLC